LALSFVSSSAVAGTTITLPAHAAGDLLILFAYRDGSVTPPTVPAQPTYWNLDASVLDTNTTLAPDAYVPVWNTIDSGGSNTNSAVCAYAIATTAAHTSGTWTSATGLAVIVLRSDNASDYGIGGHAQTGGSGANTASCPAITLSRTDDTSFSLHFAGSRNVTNWGVTPSGYTQRSQVATEVVCYTKNSTTSDGVVTLSPTNANSQSGYRGHSFEVYEAVGAVVVDMTGLPCAATAAVNLSKVTTTTGPTVPVATAAMPVAVVVIVGGGVGIGAPAASATASAPVPNVGISGAGFVTAPPAAATARLLLSKQSIVIGPTACAATAQFLAPAIGVPTGSSIAAPAANAEGSSTNYSVDILVTTPAAVATSSAVAPTIAAKIITAPAASSTAVAPLPSPLGSTPVSLIGFPCRATASAVAPTLLGTGVIAAPPAAATANSPVVGVSTTASVTIGAPACAAVAQITTPVVSSSVSASVIAPACSATARLPVPTVTSSVFTTLATGACLATSRFVAPTIVPTGANLINAPPSSATARFPAPPAPTYSKTYSSAGTGLPDFAVEIAFDSLPTADIQTWSDVTPYLREIGIRRGRNNELGRVEAGTLDLLLDNRTSRFNPENTASPYYPDVLPKKQVRVWARSGATERLLFTGFTMGFPQEWPHTGKDAIVRLAATDLIAMLARMPLSVGAPDPRDLTANVDLGVPAGTDTVLTVSAPTQFWPVSFPYTITVDQEDMTVTEAPTSTSLLVTRGANDTTVVAHPPGTAASGLGVSTQAAEFPAQTSGDRIVDVITHSLFTGLTVPTGFFSNVDAGLSTLVSSGILTDTASPLELIQNAVDSENGLFYIGGDGKPVFRDRHTRILNQTPLTTFGDNVGEVEYADITVSHDETQLYNIININLPNSVTRTASDSASKAAYWPSVLPRESQTLPSEGSDLAHYLLARYKDPQLRVPNLTLDGHKVAGTTLINLDLDQRYTVIRRPTSGTAISKDVFSEGVSLTIAPTQWRTSLDLSLASTETYWILGTSHLNTETRVGY
jgi:hypothetical protein